MFAVTPSLPEGQYVAIVFYPDSQEVDYTREVLGETFKDDVEASLAVMAHIKQVEPQIDDSTVIVFDKALSDYAMLTQRGNYLYWVGLPENANLDTQWRGESPL